ncbi:ThuA domain-containing protein [Jiangella asiatica]|uniref:Trehalose utilization protein ThuA n=1 Tax=Jiangella asiatica TaxID=2530372 RepID=A0A4R5CRD8_9ACTN|nr:ThuA domain-containing protein [Jiangella asiatica]TDE03109.1 trehalose utilization protein ThuA [Jiangella asiatica]
MTALTVTVWNEFVHEREEPEVQAIYPKGIHSVIADALQARLGGAVHLRSATLDQPEHGLSEEVLETTDVLIWWSHIAQEQVADEVVERVHDRVLRGMGMIALHSATKSKIFRKLMGTSCCVRWRREKDREFVWTIKPDHPIAAGLPEVFSIPQQEMFCEFFDVPDPDELVFISSFPGGEVLRSGLCYRRGYGRVFYFSPGDQDFPVYHHPLVQQVLANAVQWARPAAGVRTDPYLSRNSPTGWLDAVPHGVAGK